MKKLWMVLSFCLLTGSFSAAAQPGAGDSFQKNFKKFAGLVPGVDFYASEREAVTPFEKPLGEGIARLKTLLGENLPAGVLVICKSIAEKDTVAEERLLKMGYKWAFIQVSPQAEMEQMLEQVKARMGNQVPPEMLARFQNRTPEQNQSMIASRVSAMVPRISFAVVSTLLAPDKEFKGSRVDDVSRSPLADWVDVGVSRYAANSTMFAVRWTQDHFDELVPLEDLLEMNRPFVPPDMAGAGGGGGGGMRIVMGGPGGGGAAGGPAPAPPAGGGGTVTFNAGAPGGGGMNAQMPKEVQDRFNFDNQASMVFGYLVEKIGIDKARDLVKANREGKETAALLSQPEFLGKPIDEVEKEWGAWVKAQKAPPMPQQQMIRGNAPAPEAKPPAKP